MKNITNIFSNLFTPKKRIITACLLAFLFLGNMPAIAQTYYSVTAPSGTVAVGGINVTVTSAGAVSIASCGIEGPYYEGMGSPGSYTWSFSSPVTAVRLHIGAFGVYGGDLTSVYINGVYYPLTSANLSTPFADCFASYGYTDCPAIIQGGDINNDPSCGGGFGIGYTQLDISGIGPIHSFELVCQGGSGGILNDFNFAAGAAPPATPTLSQWGLIIFSLLLLSFGMVFVYRRQSAMVLVGAMAEEKPSTFNRSLYIKALGAVLLIAVAGLITTYRYFGSLTITDTLGTLASACVVAYMVQLSLLMKKK